MLNKTKNRSLRGLGIMAASGDPRKRAAKKTSTAKSAVGGARPRPRPTTVTSADEWLADQEGRLIELPSGKVVRMISPGMKAFLKADIIPNELMPIVMRAVDEHQPMAQKEVEELAQDPGMMVKLADSLDKIFQYCVVEPRFELPPDEDDMDAWNESHRDDQVRGPDELRVRGTLYVDRVSMDDKSYVFNVAVGGTVDLEQFRRESATQLASLSASQGL